MKILVYIPAVLAVFFVAINVFPNLVNVLELSESNVSVIFGAGLGVWAINMIVFLKRTIA